MSAHTVTNWVARITASGKSSGPFGVELLKYTEGFYSYTGDHFLRHDLSLRVPDIPQARSKDVHHL